MIGKKLAHYEISSRLGAGGMGEVYQARDSKLGRHVAVKVLPEALAGDPDRIARFEREAKLLAALNHPHIASLYGMELVEETHFLVMELVEGETLAERIAKGALPPDDALRCAHEIAQALEAAHEKGVIHRDLKPANVKITPEGNVKVLDFGLAKAMGGENAAANVTLSNSPTLSVMATNAGVILGTAAYMSPEQARGENVDHRSDIFSFGCVLFEMLTGRQTFQGRTAPDIMASVLARDPDLQTLPPALNPRIRQLLRRALEKDLKRRWQTVADLRAEIEVIQEDGAIGGQVVTPVQKPIWKRAIPVLITSLVLSAITAFAVWNLRPGTHPVVTRFPFVLPEDETFTNPGRSLLALSPDGTQLVYVANSRLYLRKMSELESRPIPGAEAAQGGVLNPVFSPDGGSIAFFVQGENALKRIAVTGGTAVTICPATNPFGMSWEKDTIIFGQASSGIMKVPATGGKAEVLVALKDGVADTPQMLPDSETILFTLSSSLGGRGRLGTEVWDKSQVVVQSLKTGQRKVIVEGGSAARYIPTGHIVYAFSGTLRAVPFDLKRLEAHGGAVPIVEGVMRANSAQTGVAHFSVSDNGTLAYIPGPVDVSASGGVSVLGFADRKGTVEPLKLPAGTYGLPRISPDGKRITFNTTEGNGSTIWVYDLSGESSMRKLTLGGSNRFPMWSGDGEYIVFQSDREGDLALFRQRADGISAAERLTKAEAGTSHIPGSWPAKFRQFSFSSGKLGEMHVSIFSLDDRKTAPFSTGRSNQARSVISPDGRWVAYQSSELVQTNNVGGNEIFVEPNPPTGTKYQITRGGGTDPLWSPDGRELFYALAQRLHAVNIKAQPFSFSDAVDLPLPRFIPSGPNSHRNFDITPDGKRFLMVFLAAQTEPQAPPASEIRFVSNWFEELKQRVPVK